MATKYGKKTSKSVKVTSKKKSSRTAVKKKKTVAKGLTRVRQSSRRKRTRKHLRRR